MAHMDNAGERSPANIKRPGKVRLNLDSLASPERWMSLLVVLSFFSLWEWLARTERISTLFFPAPSAIAVTIVEMAGNGTLSENLIATLKRVFSGFMIGGGVGLLLGLLMGWSTRLRTALDPIIAALHPVPKISLLPIILVIFGFGESSRVVMVSISAFFPMLINSMSGVTQIKPTYFEVAKNYGANRWKVFQRVVLPAALPMVLTGFRLALTMSLTITIVVEIRFGNSGLGTVIWLAWETLRTQILYATVAVLASMGMIFNFSLLWLARQWVPWHERLGR